MDKKLWPKDYNRKEIIATVNELYREAETNQIKPGRVTYLLQRAQLGLNYLESKENKRSGNLAISLATLSLFVTMIFSVLDYLGSKQWQDNQLKVLNLIQSDLNSIQAQITK